MFDWVAGIPDLAIGYLVEIIFALVAATLLPVAYRLLKIKADDSRRQLLEAALQNGIRWALQFAVKEAQRRSQTRGIGRAMSPTTNTLLGDPELSEGVIEQAKRYVKDSAPSALKHLKVTDADLTRVIEARLPAVAIKTEDERNRLL